MRTHPYRDATAGLATRHDKLPLVGPAFAAEVGLRIVTVDVDTDALGTFSGEVPRRLDQWETAIEKARLGMSRSGLAIGLASEGSFGVVASFPFAQADHELIVLLDDERGIVVGEWEVGLGLAAVRVEVPWSDIESVPLGQAGFPQHGLIVRASGSDSAIVKGIHDLDSLARAMRRCSGGRGTVIVESDLRAHHHPGRRSVIARAADRLARRVATLCPMCRCPGWGVVRREPGAPCEECRWPTRRVREEILACPQCDCEESRPTSDSGGVDPMFCSMCNP